MSKSPTAFLPVLIICVLLIAVFSARKNELRKETDIRRKQQREHLVRTRFIPLQNVRTKAKESDSDLEVPPADPVWFAKQIKMITSGDLLRTLTERVALDEHWNMKPWEAVERMQRHLEVVQEPGTPVISLTFSLNSQGDATEIAETIREVYEEHRNNEIMEERKRLKQEPIGIKSAIKVLDDAKKVGEKVR